MFRSVKSNVHLVINPSSLFMGQKQSLRSKKVNFGGGPKFEASSESQKEVKPVTLAYASYKAATTEVGKPVIILHGLFGSKSNWNSVSKQLAASSKKEVIAVDIRNHGESPHTKEFTFDHICEDIKQLLIHLKADDGESTLLGHSLGGRAFMHFAMRHPKVVKKLIIVDISPIGMTPNVGELPEIIGAMAGVKLEDNMQFAVARMTADKQLAGKIKNPLLRQFLLTNLVYDDEAGGWAWKVNLKAVIENFHTLFDQQKWNGVFDKPVLFIGGTNSQFLPREHEVEIKKIFPKAQFKYIVGASHLLHIEKMAEFLAITNEFLKQD